MHLGHLLELRRCDLLVLRHLVVINLKVDICFGGAIKLELRLLHLSGRCVRSHGLPHLLHLEYVGTSGFVLHWVIGVSLHLCSVLREQLARWLRTTALLGLGCALIIRCPRVHSALVLR